MLTVWWVIGIVVVVVAVAWAIEHVLDRWN
jgi:hypothetical protein